MIADADIIVYYRVEDEEVTIKFLKRIITLLYPWLKVDLRVSEMVPEGNFLVIRSDCDPCLISSASWS
jgi:hypothetical protein